RVILQVRQPEEEAFQHDARSEVVIRERSRTTHRENTDDDVIIVNQSRTLALRERIELSDTEDENGEKTLVEDDFQVLGSTELPGPGQNGPKGKGKSVEKAVEVIHIDSDPASEPTLKEGNEVSSMSLPSAGAEKHSRSKQTGRSKSTALEISDADEEDAD